MASRAARRTLSAAKPFEHLPRRLWQAFLTMAAVEPERRWADLPIKAERQQELLCAQSVSIQGRGPFGEEFVTAGTALGDVNLATMQVAAAPVCIWLVNCWMWMGSGGFNFQACWSGGWLAGQAVAAALIESDQTP